MDKCCFFFENQVFLVDFLNRYPQQYAELFRYTRVVFIFRTLLWITERMQKNRLSTKKSFSPYCTIQDTFFTVFDTGRMALG